MRQLTTLPLTESRIGQAYPLIQAALPEVTLDAWQRFAEPLVAPSAGPETGILTVESERGYIAGLSIYRIYFDLRHGSALVADHFMALDLFDRITVVHALAEALESLGREHGCVAVHTNVPDRGTKLRVSENSLVAALRERGHSLESLRLCKLLRKPGQVSQPESRRGEEPAAPTAFLGNIG